MASDSLADEFRAHQSLFEKSVRNPRDILTALESIIPLNTTSHIEIPHHGLTPAQSCSLSGDRSAGFAHGRESVSGQMRGMMSVAREMLFIGVVGTAIASLVVAGS